MLSTTRMWMLRLMTSDQAIESIAGMAAGTVLIVAFGSYWTTFIPSSLAVVAVTLVVAGVLALLHSSVVGRLIQRMPPFVRWAVASCGVAMLPVVWKWLLTKQELVPLSAYDSAVLTVAVHAAFALPLLGGAVVCGGLLSCRTGRTTEGGVSRWYWTGLAVSECVVPWTVMVSVGADRLLSGLAAGLLVLAGGSLLFAREDNESAPASLSASQEGAGWLAFVLACLAGFGLSKVSLMADQLVLETLTFKGCLWAGLLIGMVAGTGGRSTIGPPALVRTAAWCLGGAACLGLWLFPWGMRWAVWSSAHVSSLAGIFLAKGAIPFLLAAPWGVVVGRLVKIRLSGGIVWALAGGFAAAQGLSVSTNMALPVLGTIGLLTGLTTLDHSFWRWRPFTGCARWRVAGLAASALLIGGVWLTRGAFDPVQSARVVFSGEAFASAANGYDLDTILKADRGRCLVKYEVEGVVWTHWRTRGNQSIVRRNGIPVSQITLDPGLGPQNFWSTMAVLVPVLAHPQADHVLVLGDTSSVEVATALELPIHSLTCVQPQGPLQALIQQQATTLGVEHRWEDSRLQAVSLDPSRFLAAPVVETFDVIVCPAALTMSLSAQPHLTREYYQRAAARLNDSGLLCQRVNIVDYGSQPVKELCQTLRDVFQQVTILTTDGSEVLLLASSESTPLFDETMVARLDTPQVRGVCGKLGGDWTMVTQLAGLPAESVEELLKGAVPGNSSRNVRFMATLGPEMLRWGDKHQEKRKLFSNGVDLVLNQMGLSDEAKQPLVRRIQDSQERVTTLTEIPDNAWEYRKLLKTALKDRPRASLRTVNHELKRTLDPDDQRRKAYLAALGQLVTQPQLAPEAVEGLLEFAAPFDPLLTDFVHFEVAHLLARATPRDPVQEYRHWMHCVLSSPDRDRSIRTVGSAMQLLAEYADVPGHPELRWDHAQLLLEVMRMRWVLRWQPGVSPSKFEPSDRQFSLDAIQSVLRMMDATRESAGIDQATWQVQRRVWEDTLVSPLRTRQTYGNSNEHMKAIVQQEWLKKQMQEKSTQSLSHQ